LGALMRLHFALFAAASLLPSMATAQPTVVERLLALSRQANFECNRQQLPEPALGAACQAARSYDEALATLGFCFDSELNEWSSCALANQGEPPHPKNHDLPQTESQVERVPPQEPDLAPVTPPERESPPPPERAEVPPEPSGSGWESYSNARFGTVIDVPPGFEPRTSVENGDGQTFASPDGESEVAVYGSLLENQSLQQYRDWYRSELSGKSYEAGGRNWFVVSGTAEGKIYYVKVVRTAHCGVPVVHHMVLRYPEGQKRRYDSVVERLADSLRGTARSSYCQG
jgi:hypothetical protein